MSRLSIHTLLLFVLLFALDYRANAQPPPAPQDPTPPTIGSPEERANRALTTRRPLTSAPSLSVWVGEGKSDNITRSDPPLDGSVTSVGLLLDVGHQSPRAQAYVNSDLEFRKYSIDFIKRETVGTIDAGADLSVVPNRFSWMVRGSHGPAIVDPFEPEGPLNRENVDSFATGPRLDLPLGTRTNLALGADYSQRRYERTSNADNESTLYYALVSRRISSTTQLGIAASSTDLTYDGLVPVAYTINRASFRYDKTLATGQLSANVGKNNIDAGPLTRDAPLFEFEWTKSLATRSSLGVSAQRGFVETGNALNALPDLGSVNTGSSLQVATTPADRSAVEVEYRYVGSRVRAEAAVGALKHSYPDNPSISNESTTSHLAFSRAISQRLGVVLAWDRTHRSHVASEDDAASDSLLAAWVNRTLGEHFSIAGAISHYERRGERSFGENRYEFRLVYTPTRRANSGIGAVGR